jgi:iron complex outermembrane receptor protein
MNAIVSRILAEPGFTPALLGVAVVLYAAWTAAYLCIIVRCHRDQSYGVPFASLSFNVVWEACYSFNLLDQRLSPFFLWGNRAWLLFDLVLYYQFLRYGPKVQVLPWLARFFYPAALVTLVLNAVGLATFTSAFHAYTGSASSMAMNFSMSILYIFMLSNRPDLRGLSYPAAWLKMIGTVAGSVFLYSWLPAQYAGGELYRHPGVPPPGNFHFMHFLYVGIFVADVVYITLFTIRRRELRAPGGADRPSRVCRAYPPAFVLLPVPLLAFSLFALGGLSSGAQTSPTSGGPVEPSAEVVERLRDLDLENLLSSVASKKEEPIFVTPAAVTVVNAEEIRRAGVRTLPDALRLVPGMEVAQINGNQWAVSARGFNDRFANKFLVLQDGRALYTPQFGGTFWDVQRPLLADLDQIEVVRGPGGTLWGANAVNGVVNIVTKDARDTLGTYAASGGGPYQAFAEARYGDRLGDSGAWRAYVKYDWQERLPLGDGENFDGSETFGTGFRADWEANDNHLTLQGDYLRGEREQPIYYADYAPPYASLAHEAFDVENANVLARWTHTFEDGTDIRLQAYWDHLLRDPESFPLRHDVGDFELQHRILLPGRQELTYGAGYRHYRDHVDNRRIELVEDPASRTLPLWSAFVRDEIGIVEDTLNLIVGSKFEDNDFTGFEVQPDARLLWLAASNHTVWTGVSRAVRTPTRAHEDLTALQPLPFGLARYTGNRDIESEDLLCLQAGWRVRFGDRAGADLSTYYGFYDDLDSNDVGTPFVEDTPAPPHVIVPVRTVNAGRVDTFGVELGADYRPLEWWQLRGGYSYFGYTGAENLAYDSAATPEHQVFVRSSMDLPADLELDLWGRYRSALELYDLDGFVELDVRLAWRPRPWLEVALVGQNLVHDTRQDFGIPPFNIAAPVSEVPRTFYGQVTVRF